METPRFCPFKARREFLEAASCLCVPNGLVYGSSITSDVKRAKTYPTKYTSKPETIGERSRDKDVTVVWDIDLTLGNLKCPINTEGNVDLPIMIRPHVLDVIAMLSASLSNRVEHIIWTHGTVEHAFRMERSLGVKFDYVIHRGAEREFKTKNLHLLKRDMGSIVLIDDNPNVGCDSPDNMLLVPEYSHVGTYDSTLVLVSHIVFHAARDYISFGVPIPVSIGKSPLVKTVSFVKKGRQVSYSKVRDYISENHYKRCSLFSNLIL